MMAQFFPPNRRALIPEVVQTSAMDCGPATLKAMLEGFNIPVSYGRLREACQTDVDGTSIDTLEEVAVQLGLHAEQIMLPADHLLLPEAEALPAIVVVKKPNGLTHFVVIWQGYGQFLQVMDPAVGRRWLPRQRLLNELYQHQFPVPLAAWREWAGSAGFVAPLRQRLGQLRLEPPAIDRLISAAVADPDWYGLAALDAAARMVESIVQAGGVERGAEAAAVLHRFLAPAEADTGGLGIPAPFWSVRPLPAETLEPDSEPHLTMHGAVLIRVTGVRDETAALAEESPAPLSPDLLAALAETPPRPEWEMLTYLRADGLLTPAVLLIALALSTGAVMLEAVMLRGLLTIGNGLGTVGQRMAGLAALFVFLALMLLLELPIAATALRVGRRFETRLRMAFLEKIPRLGDKYFHSRLTSDMTQRVHDLSQMRQLPHLGLSLARLAFQLLLTAAGVVILVPGSAPLAFLSMVAAVGLSLLSQPLLREQDLRMRTHTGALSRFYLDAMLGLFPVRTHGAERAVRREHEGLLVEWLRSGGAYYRLDVVLQTVSALVGTFFSVWILFDYVNSGGDPSGIFLLFYWTLSLPALGLALADVAQQYPIYRSRMLRVLEPLGAPNETDFTPAPATPPAAPAPGGVSITLDNVTVQAGGHPILSDITLHLKPGEHIGIVGPSGAGKSSLVGLLLGWHRPAAGQILVDGEPLAGPRLYHLRRETAWVDPAVQLWNRSLLDNLRYGAEGDVAALNQAINQADLFAVLEKLPQGQQTPLGEGGGLVSGGEGQRVRLGRAMLRPGARLAILDEPFRGLDRAQRRELLQQSRRHWAGATLICITHDVGETRHFERVLVIENGRIIEDGPPDSLLARPHSRYGELLAAEEAVRQGMWGGEQWRHLRLEEGQLHHD